VYAVSFESRVITVLNTSKERQILVFTKLLQAKATVFGKNNKIPALRRRALLVDNVQNSSKTRRSSSKGEKIKLSKTAIARERENQSPLFFQRVTYII